MFDRPEALKIAHCVDAAYTLHGDADQAVTEGKTLGYPTVIPVSVGSVQALILGNITETVIAIAGSASVDDWAANFKFHRVGLEGDDDPRRVHRGFRRSVALALDAIMLAVNEVHSPHRKRLVIAGHSKGAGEAVLLAYAMAKRPEFKADAVYLMGCPRVGNRRFAREYDFVLGGVTWRIVNNNDAVCRLPPAGLRVRHVGRLVYVDWLGKVLDEPGLLRRGWNQLAGRVWAWWHDKNWIDGGTDHLMPAYLGVLNQ